MMALRIGYARCSTDKQHLTAQRDRLICVGVAPTQIYVDHGLTYTNREPQPRCMRPAGVGECDTAEIRILWDPRCAAAPTTRGVAHFGRSTWAARDNNE
jgi:hypothetical protein